MGKGKLAKFAEMEVLENVFQYPFSVIDNVPFEMKGHWREQYFKKREDGTNFSSKTTIPSCLNWVAEKVNIR